MLFWMARRTVRSCTSGRSGGGAGCLVVILAMAVIGGITGGGAQAPVAGPHGWHQGPDGVYIPDSPPIIYGTGGPDWAGPTQTGPKPPAHASPVSAAPAPAPAPAPAAPNRWPIALMVLAIIVVPLGGLAIIGSRMAPKPIWTPPKDGPPDFPAAEQLGGGGPPPDNPAKWSDRR
jgi:hypothetical protein